MTIILIIFLFIFVLNFEWFIKVLFPFLMKMSGLTLLLLGVLVGVPLLAYFCIPYFYEIGKTNDLVMTIVQVIGLISLIYLIVTMIFHKK